MLPTMLDVSNALKNPGQEYPFSVGVVLEAMEVLGDPVQFEDISVQGEFLCTGESISVHGTMAARVVTRCSKCLGPVDFDINADFDEQFVRLADPDDPDSYVFQASSVELTEPVKNALLLELPMRILCSEDCKGLCPQCGKNLNEGSCACPEGGEVTNPFSALTNFVTNDEEV